MALVTEAIPNLIQGVSQQSEKQRIDGQGSEQENAMSNVVEGLTKRPPFKHTKQLLLNQTKGINDLSGALITVTDYANISAGTTLAVTKSNGSVITFTSEAAGSGSPSSSLGFRPYTNNDTTADNIYTTINSHADFTVANPSANIVEVKETNPTLSNGFFTPVTIVSSDTTRLAITAAEVTQPTPLPSIADDSFCHFVDRSENEKYAVIIDPTVNKMYAYNTVTGAEATIDGATGGKDIQDTYLDTNLATDIKALTVGDSTFLLNTKTSVGLGSTRTDALPKEGAVFVSQGAASNTKYRTNVTVNGGASTTGVAAEITFEMERYLHSKSATNTYYRWRIKGNPTVVSGGAGYSVDETTIRIKVQPPQYETGGTARNFLPTTYTGIPDSAGEADTRWVTAHPKSFSKITGNATFWYQLGRAAVVYIEPTFTFTVNASGAIQTITTTNAGSFEGVGTYTVTGRGAGTYHKPNPPNAWIEVAGFAAGVQTSFSSVYTSDDSRTHDIASEIKSAFDTADSSAGDLFDTSLQTDSHLVMITRKVNSSDFSISTEDDLAGNGLKALYKEVGAITDLPVYCKNGFRIKVRGSENSNYDDFYVKHFTDSGNDYGDGSWKEDVGYDIIKGINSDTLPRQLKLTDENTFTLSNMNFAERVTGDDVTNPMPSFVGQTINGMFFYKNRLGFLSQDNVIFSEAGYGIKNDAGDVVFNFFRTSVQSLLDSDPIDVTVNSPRVIKLSGAVGFQENLILFSSEGQFSLRGADLLTNRTIAITPITNFESNEIVSPIAQGSFIYFPFNRGDFSGIQEFTVTSDTDNYTTNEITEHVPAYIPSNIRQLAGSTSENILAVQDNTTLTDIYIYKYFHSGNKKLLSSWSKFTSPFKIINFSIFDGTLYAVVTKEGSTHIVSMDLQEAMVDTGMEYTTGLDIRKEIDLMNTETFEVIWNSELNKFEIDGVASPALNLRGGVPYIFDLSSTTLDGKLFKIGNQAEADGASWESGGSVVIRSGTAGTTDAKVTFTADAVGTAFYFENSTANAGNVINTIGQYELYLDYTASIGDTIKVYDDEGNELAVSASMPLSAIARSVTLSSAHEGTIYVGIPYTMKYTFTNPFVKQQANQSMAPSGFSKNKIRNGSVLFTESSGFDVKVTPNASITGATTYTNSVADSATLDTGVFRFPVFGDVGDTKITIESDSVFPAKFSSAEFEMFFHQRSRRIG